MATRIFQCTLGGQERPVSVFGKSKGDDRIWVGVPLVPHALSCDEATSLAEAISSAARYARYLGRYNEPVIEGTVEQTTRPTHKAVSG